jgi:hypothetical protein
VQVTATLRLWATPISGPDGPTGLDFEARYNCYSWAFESGETFNEGIFIGSSTLRAPSSGSVFEPESENYRDGIVDTQMTIIGSAELTPGSWDFELTCRSDISIANSDSGVEEANFNVIAVN